MAEVGIRFQEDMKDTAVDHEFDEFLSKRPAHGSPSESKENVESNGTNGEAVVANGVSVAPIGNDRIKWKAKRPSKFVLSRTNSDTCVNAPLRALKNSRRSRNGFSRGLPKKGQWMMMFC